MNEQLKEAVSEAIREALGGALDCGRVWSAWGVGTMSEDDFSVVADDDERVAEIADAVMTALAARQPVGQERVAWASTGATGHKVVAMPGLHKLPYGDYDLYAAPPAQGIDLGQLARHEPSPSWDGVTMKSSEKGEWVRLSDVTALIDQRDAAPGVGNGE